MQICTHLVITLDFEEPMCEKETDCTTYLYFLLLQPVLVCLLGADQEIKEQAVIPKPLLATLEMLSLLASYGKLGLDRNNEEFDVLYLQETYDLMADEKFVLSKIFRFYETKYPGNRPWSSYLPAEYFFPPNYKEIFSMLRGAMYLGAGELVTEISKALEIDEVKLHGSVDSVRGLVRDRVRVSLHKQQCAMLCFICSRTFHQHPPARDVITKMPCCLGDVHPTACRRPQQPLVTVAPTVKCPSQAQGLIQTSPKLWTT